MSSKGRQNRKGSRKWLASVMKSSGSKRRYVFDQGDYKDERWGTHTQERKGVRFEDLPVFQPMKKSREFWCGKINAGPLKQFLRNKVGENWDDIYSEITERLPSKIVDRKAEIVSWFVCPKVMIDDKGIIDISRDTTGWNYIMKFDGSIKFSPYSFYIHPETNILTSIK